MNYKAKTSAALLAACLFSFLFALDGLRFRWDLSEEKLYTLAPATQDLLDHLEDRLQVKLYFNQNISGAEHLLPSRKVLVDLLEEIAQHADGKVVLEMVDPTVDLVAARDAEHVGITPITVTDREVGGVSLESLYQGLEMRYQDQSAVIPFVVPAELEFAFAARLSSLLRGKRPVVGILSREPALSPPIPGIPQQASAGRIYERLREILGSRYAVRDYRELNAEITLDPDLAALIVASPAEVTPQELAGIQEFLESGGHVLVFMDHEKVNPQQGFQVTPKNIGLDAWLATYGITVHAQFVFDLRAQVLPVGEEIVTLPDGRRARNIVTMPYGLFPLIEGDGLSSTHLVTGGLDRVAMMWAHPISYRQTMPGLKAENLLRTSSQAWALPADTRLAMSRGNLELLKATAAAKGAPSRYALATTLSGSFKEGGVDGVLTVLGDADLFHNRSLPPGSENALFAMNLVDWLAQDAALIPLRSRGRKSRPIKDYYQVTMAALGGPAGTDVENRELDRQAKAQRRQAHRQIAWNNVLLPPMAMLFAALGHFAYRRHRAKLPFQSSETAS